MKCAKVKTLLSAYLDSAVTGNEMRALDIHLNGCEPCRMAFRGMRQTQQLLAVTARRKPSADLSLKLRLAISREIAQRHSSARQPVWDRIEYALRDFMLPTMAGLATAVVLFAVFMGFSALPLQAGNADVPLMVNTAPELEQSAFETAMSSVNDDSLVIEAYVNSDGRVEDYRILSDSAGSKDLTRPVKNMLINFMTFTTFHPATSMGRPTPGHAILSFSKINVKG
ncbi:MAG: zf-HC2 domain-containing protein [Terriglobales bacterium]